jgi:hypothetical protein
VTGQSPLTGPDPGRADPRPATTRAVEAGWVQAEILRRAVTHLARSGISQYFDIGAGLPTAGNVHEIAQRINHGHTAFGAAVRSCR